MYASLSVVEEFGQGMLESKSEEDDQSSKNLDGSSDGSKVHVHVDDEAILPVIPPMDELLNECFYMAIKSSVKKEDLPMLTSTFYRSHMMPLW